MTIKQTKKLNQNKKQNQNLAETQRLCRRNIIPPPHAPMDCADDQLQLSPACDARPLLVASEEGITPEIERVSEGALNVSARAKRKEYYKQASLAEPSRAEPKRHLRKEGKPLSCLRSFRVTPCFWSICKRA